MADYLADAVAAFEFYLQAQKTGRAQAPILLEQVTSAMDKLQREQHGHAEEQAAEAKQAPEHAPGPAGEPEKAAPAESEAGAEFDEEVDPEIREIFLEEAQDVLGDLKARLPRWAKEPVVDENMGAIRRAFHTFKGSGRMVNATEIGELSWSVENLLNRCLEGALPLTEKIVATVQDAVKVMPGLLERFGASGGPSDEAAELMDRAHKQAEVRAPGEAYEQESAEEPGTAGEGFAEQPGKGPETDADQAAGDQEEEKADPELLRVFFADADKRIESLDGHLHGQGDAQPKLFDVMRSMHVLRGSAETAGLPALAQLAEVIEDIYESIRNLRISIQGDLREDLEKAGNILYEALQQIGRASCR